MSRPTKAVCIAALRRVEQEFAQASSGSPYVLLYISRKQAEAIRALLIERVNPE